MQQLEHQSQKALMTWAKRAVVTMPELRWLFAIPNGGDRHPITAAKLKAEGVKKGVLDLMLPVARCGYHGLFIEMKAGRNKPTAEQLEFMAFLTEQGYLAVICWDWTVAKDEITKYLRGDNERI
jgi:hypothetical protein